MPETADNATSTANKPKKFERKIAVLEEKTAMTDAIIGFAIDDNNTVVSDNKGDAVSSSAQEWQTPIDGSTTPSDHVNASNTIQLGAENKMVEGGRRGDLFVSCVDISEEAQQQRIGAVEKVVAGGASYDAITPTAT